MSQAFRRFVFAASTKEMQNLFKARWIVEGLPSQTLIIPMLRTGRCLSTNGLPQDP